MMGLRILLWLVVIPVLLFLCALTMIRLPLPQPFPPALSRGRNLMAAIVTGVLGLGYILGLALYVVSGFLRAGRVLDPVLISMGLSSQNYLLFGRQYHGEIEGRKVDIFFVPSQLIWPTQLNIYVEADLGTRVAIGQQRPLLDCRDCVQLDVGEAGLSGLHVVAQEEERADRLLSNSAAREALTRLLDEQEVYGLREVYLQPERIWLRAHPRGMGEGQFRQWVDDLLALAGAAERALESSE